MQIEKQVIDGFKTAGWVIGSLIGVTLVVVLIWVFTKTFNYSWFYQSNVQQTICEMVKPENLTKPEICDVN